MRWYGLYKIWLELTRNKSTHCSTKSEPCDQTCDVPDNFHSKIKKIIVYDFVDVTRIVRIIANATIYLYYMCVPLSYYISNESWRPSHQWLNVINAWTTKNDNGWGAIMQGQYNHQHNHQMLLHIYNQSFLDKGYTMIPRLNKFAFMKYTSLKFQIFPENILPKYCIS